MILKKIFWSKYTKWLRKLLGIEKPKIDIEDVLNATGGPAILPRGYYTTFSGVDVKTYFEDENQNFLCVPEIQAVSCRDHLEDKVRGDIITLIFDREALAALPFKPKNMLLVACNEYGTLCYTKFKDIKFTTKRWNVDIDSIITRSITEFEAESCVHWKNANNDLRKLESWPSNLPEQIQERLRTYE